MRSFSLGHIFFSIVRLCPPFRGRVSEGRLLLATHEGPDADGGKETDRHRSDRSKSQSPSSLDHQPTEPGCSPIYPSKPPRSRHPDPSSLQAERLPATSPPRQRHILQHTSPSPSTPSAPARRRSRTTRVAAPTAPTSRSRRPSEVQATMSSPLAGGVSTADDPRSLPDERVPCSRASISRHTTPPAATAAPHTRRDRCRPCLPCQARLGRPRTRCGCPQVTAGPSAATPSSSSSRRFHRRPRCIHRSHRRPRRRQSGRPSPRSLAALRRSHRTMQRSSGRLSSDCPLCLRLRARRTHIQRRTHRSRVPITPTLIPLIVSLSRSRRVAMTSRHDPPDDASPRYSHVRALYAFPPRPPALQWLASPLPARGPQPVRPDAHPINGLPVPLARDSPSHCRPARAHRVRNDDAECPVCQRRRWQAHRSLRRRLGLLLVQRRSLRRGRLSPARNRPDPPLGGRSSEEQHRGWWWRWWWRSGRGSWRSTVLFAS